MIQNTLSMNVHSQIHSQMLKSDTLKHTHTHTHKKKNNTIVWNGRNDVVTTMTNYWTCEKTLHNKAKETT